MGEIVVLSTKQLIILQLQLLGNALDFGDLTTTLMGSCASAIRGFFTGGYFTVSNNIDYVTISSTGNGFDFGDLLFLLVEELDAINATRRNICRWI